MEVNMQYIQRYLGGWFFSLLIAVNTLWPALSLSQNTTELITIGEKQQIYSDILKEIRPLLVYRPSGYDQSNDAYPVLYILDGARHFHHTTGTVQFLSRTKRIPDMIVVAISSTERTRDLTPPTQVDSTNAYPTSGGAGEFLAFLKDELIPQIDKTYRTRPYRVLAGHSFGGLFVIYTLVTQSDLFNGYLAISPSLWWNDQALVSETENFLNNNSDLKGDLYMTMGNEGGNMLGGALKLSGVFEEKASENFRWNFKLMDQETHSSIVHRSTYEGLEKIFEGWYIHDPMAYYDKGGIQAIDNHYKKVSERIGYNQSTPLSTVYQIGNTLLSQDRVEEAVQVYKRVIKENPLYASAYNNLGNAYRKQENIELAIENYLKSLELNPANEDAKKILTELDVDVTALTPDVTVDPLILVSYIGEYRGPVIPGGTMDIIMEDNQLYYTYNSQRMELHPISETRFYRSDSDVQITFNLNETGDVVGMTMHNRGEIVETVKVE